MAHHARGAVQVHSAGSRPGPVPSASAAAVLDEFGDLDGVRAVRDDIDRRVQSLLHQLTAGTASTETGVTP